MGDYSNLNPTQYITRSFSNMIVSCFVAQNLKISKASTAIPNKCIKLAVDLISEALTGVFNYSLVQGTVSYILKASRVTSIDGDEADPSNFRPTCRLGFRRGRSTEQSGDGRNKG